MATFKYENVLFTDSEQKTLRGLVRMMGDNPTILVDFDDSQPDSFRQKLCDIDAIERRFRGQNNETIITDKIKLIVLAMDQICEQEKATDKWELVYRKFRSWWWSIPVIIILYFVMNLGLMKQWYDYFFNKLTP